VDAASLGAQLKPPAFIDHLNKILQKDGCAPAEESPQKIVIVAGSNIRFQQLTRTPRIELTRSYNSIRLYYFLDNKYHGADDDLYKVLKSFHPIRYVADDRTSFLKSLKNMISELEK
jgi:hypothetical protein